jgi:ABC-type lipoprotein export system ATPase subunit
MTLLALDGVVKGFRSDDGDRRVVVRVPRFRLNAGQRVGLAGPSGSGKTTLLHLIAGILTPDSGTVHFEGEAFSQLPEPQRDQKRARHMGYVFQTFNLLQGLTALENVLLAQSLGNGVDGPVRPGPARRSGVGKPFGSSTGPIVFGPTTTGGSGPSTR